MNSSLIGKIEKAHRYARELERVKFRSFTATFDGENDVHEVGFAGNRWSCTCDFFSGWGLCSHTMALEKMLEPMLPPEAVQKIEAAPPRS